MAENKARAMVEAMSPPAKDRRWIAKDRETGDEFLVVAWAEGGIEVSPRLDHTRWGIPMFVREVD